MKPFHSLSIRKMKKNLWIIFLLSCCLIVRADPGPHAGPLQPGRHQPGPLQTGRIQAGPLQPADTSLHHGRFRLADSLIFDQQFAFLPHDSVVFFLTTDASKLSQLPCAGYYRPARMNKFFLFDGPVTDYYMSNDSVARQLTYQDGYLNGPCVEYYENGKIREQGEYVKNVKHGIWNYYFENGQKAKSIRFTDSAYYLIDCFAEDGTPLAKDGYGKFDGEVVTNTFQSPLHCRITGTVKNGLPEGEWKIFLQKDSKLIDVEIFENGGFIRGTSYSKAGIDTYHDHSFGRVESIHNYEILDYYGQYDFCFAAGRSIGGSAMWNNQFKEIDDGLKKILGTGRYKTYSGWAFLDIKFNRKGKLIGKYVRLAHPDEALEKDMLDMLSGVKSPGTMSVNDLNVAYDKFFIVLIDASQAIIPEEVLSKQRGLPMP